MRERGLSPSIDQWMSLHQALDKGLAYSNLTEFYRLCRCLLITSEADYDLFDEVFLDYFKKTRKGDMSEDVLLDDALEWLVPPHLAEDDIFEHMEILRRLEAVILRLLRQFDEELANGRLMPGACAFCTGCGRCLRMPSEPAMDPYLFEEEAKPFDSRERTVFEIDGITCIILVTITCSQQE